MGFKRCALNTFNIFSLPDKTVSLAEACLIQNNLINQSINIYQSINQSISIQHPKFHQYVSNLTYQKSNKLISELSIYQLNHQITKISQIIILFRGFKFFLNC